MGLSCYGQSMGALASSASAFKPLTGEEVATKTTSPCDSPPCAANSKSPGYQNITIYLKSSPISSLFSYPSLVTTSPPPHLTEIHKAIWKADNVFMRLERWMPLT
ncbi:hypothetical protein LB504_003480 [Fusarium proliferatum]|nr:hypothetical protein LB504_003480 [Fusarium proliferatum]